MVNIFSSNKQNLQLSAIYSQKEFKEVVERECERADRYGQRLSLALFEIGTIDENNLAVRQLIRTIHRRFRDIDELGWYNSKQIGVILPHTPLKGAWKLAEDVNNLLTAFPQPPPFTIYTYPSERWPGGVSSNVFKIFNPLEWLRKYREVNSIYAGVEFRAALAKELDRASRHDHIFSLLVFDVSKSKANNVPVRMLIRLLNSRLRDSDEIGWLDRKRIGVILPYAPDTNASKIAENFSREALNDPTDFYVIYTYPENWFTGEKDNLKLNLPGDGTEISSTDTGKSTDTLNNNSDPNTIIVDEEKEQARLRQKKKRSYDPFLGNPIPWWKRGMDIFGALFGLIITSPLCLVATIIIKIVSKGPVIFKQERVGYQQKHFSLMKFRTMKVDAESKAHSQYVRRLIKQDGNGTPMIKMENDPRVIPFGNFIRKTYIDELPQLVNVLKGEMSLIGPRPCIPYEAKEYLQWHRKRFYITPGMTGLWQVSGKNKLTFEEMIRLDIKYENERSFWLDFQIILKTLPAIVSQFNDKIEVRKEKNEKIKENN